MRFLRILFFWLLIAVAGGATAWYFGWLPNPLAARTGAGDSASPGAATGAGESKGLCVMGWVEPAAGVVDIHGIPGDRLETLAVVEGARVKKGQILASLEGYALKQLQVAALAAQIEEAVARRDAETQLAQSRVQTAELGKEKVKLQDVEAESLQEKIRLLEDNLTLAQRDLDRLAKLKATAAAGPLSDEIVSDQDLERQQLVVHRATTELSAARADLKRLQATSKLALKAADADCVAAEAGKNEALAAIPVESLRKRLDIAKAELALAQVTAPADGTVLKIFVRAGESLGPKPILCLGNLQRMVAQAEVYEVDAKRVKVDQPVVIRSAAFHAPYDKDGLSGKVVAVGRMINTPELKSIDPFARVDRHVIPIRIELDPAGSAEAGRFVNLQVDVEIRTDGN